MDFVWNTLDYVPVVGTVKNTAEAVVAVAEGDYRRAISKGAEAAIGGTLDCMSFGASRVVMTTVAKTSGKVVAKEVGKVAAREAAAYATATAVRMYRNSNKRHSPGPFRPRQKPSTKSPGQCQPSKTSTKSPGQCQPSKTSTKSPGQYKPRKTSTKSPGKCQPRKPRRRNISTSSSELECETSTSDEESLTSSSEKKSRYYTGRRRRSHRRNIRTSSSELECETSTSDEESLTSSSEKKSRYYTGRRRRSRQRNIRISSSELECETSNSDEERLTSSSEKKNRYYTGRRGRSRWRNISTCSSEDATDTSNSELECEERVRDDESVASSSEDESRYTQSRKGKSRRNPGQKGKGASSGSSTKSGNKCYQNGREITQSSSGQTGKVASSGQDRRPNDNNNEKRAPKRGHHIINNDILKLLRKVLERFLRELRLSRLLPDIQTTFDMPQEIMDLIENELVVSTNRYLEDENARMYGLYRQRLEAAMLEYMRALYNENSGRFDDEHIQELIYIARKNIITIIEEMLQGLIFIDQTTYRYWMYEDVDICFPTDDSRRRERAKRKKKFDKAIKCVEDMLRKLADKVKALVREIIELSENVRR